MADVLLSDRVDALCILQEDLAESHEQIANMDKVYGSALFTIVAAQGQNADAGLPGVRPTYFERIGETEQPRHVKQHVAAVGNDLSIIAPFSRDNSPTQSSWVWSSRAWTFQERLLSRRLLIFSDNEMVWHCRTMIAREDMPVEQSGYSHEPLLWLALKAQHLGIGVDQYYKNGCLEVTRHGFTHVIRSSIFSEYTQMIAQYSQRTMTYESDAIHALAGLLRIFSLCFKSPCLYGLPTILLDVALLWRPDQSWKGRSSTNLFPNWSWAGWRGRVTYGDLIRMERDETGQTIDTEGIRPMLRYFVFDKETGSLQPLSGTARGLPVQDAELPKEWEAHAAQDGCESVTHSCRAPDVFDLDPRVISELSDRHLVFWTSSANRFHFGERAGADYSCPIVEAYGGMVGTAMLDSASGLTPQLLPNQSFILIAEAHYSLFGQQVDRSDYSEYLVMIIETNLATAVARRIGLGQISKISWVAAEPELKLICLG